MANETLLCLRTLTLRCAAHSPNLLSTTRMGAAPIYRFPVSILVSDGPVRFENCGQYMSEKVKGLSTARGIEYSAPLRLAFEGLPIKRQ